MENYELTDIYLSEEDGLQQWWFVGTTAIFDQYEMETPNLSTAANDDYYENVYPSMS